MTAAKPPISCPTPDCMYLHGHRGPCEDFRQAVKSMVRADVKKRTPPRGGPTGGGESTP